MTNIGNFTVHETRYLLTYITNCFVANWEEGIFVLSIVIMLLYTLYFVWIHQKVNWVFLILYRYVQIDMYV